MLTNTGLLVSVSIEDASAEALSADQNANYSEGQDVFAESQNSVKRINGLMSDFSEHGKKSAQTNRDLAQRGHLITSAEVSASFKKQAKSFTVISQRLVDEVNIFSEVFPEELLAVERYLLKIRAAGIQYPDSLQEAIRETPMSIDRALSGIYELRETAKTMPLGNTIMKKIRKPILGAIDLLASEFEGAKTMAARLN